MNEQHLANAVFQSMVGDKCAGCDEDIFLYVRFEGLLYCAPCFRSKHPEVYRKVVVGEKYEEASS